MRRSISTYSLALVVCGLWVGSALSAKTDQGQQLYVQYCGACHGKDGRGNGAVTPYLKLKVPDLTVLRKNHKGIYPVNDVMAAIDGTRPIRGHGDRQMPVWGEAFRKESEKEKYTELTALLKAKVIAEYVATLQR